MAAYCLFDNVEVTDSDALADYASRALATIYAYSGRYLVIGGESSSRRERRWCTTRC